MFITSTTPGASTSHCPSIQVEDSAAAEAAVGRTDQIVRKEAIVPTDRFVREATPGHPVALDWAGSLASLVHCHLGRMVVELGRAALQEGHPPKAAQKDWCWTKGFDFDLARWTEGAGG